ncbi:hypothetical protein T459_06368 [Capsicum annuum]|uniref:Uncharacterized protein n=1 Tax=Capsicum annuum TaxID=4072 RepID=A0A2G3AAL5_CAPAN|nr:hypothetical protein T459_06368 [Capsicum annuum]
MLLSLMLDIFTQYIFLSNQQAAPEGSQISSHNQYSIQPQSTLQRSNFQYNHETTINGQTLHSDYSDVNVNQGIEMQDTGFQLQELQFMDKNYLLSVKTQQSLHQISSLLDIIMRQRYTDCQVKEFTQLILAVMKSNEKSDLLADNEVRDLWHQFLPPSRMLSLEACLVIWTLQFWTNFLMK